MKLSKEYTAVFGTGAVGYTAIELLWRGHSHWTMTLCGGVCLMFMYVTEKHYSQSPVWKRCLAGSLFISSAELLVGFLVNILLKWNVWDYSERFLNLFGQICPLYSGLWFLLCIPCGYLCRGLRKFLIPAEEAEG